MNRKLELLEERKKKWSSSRAMSELTEQVTKESANDVQLSRPDSSVTSRSHNSSDNRPVSKNSSSPSKKNNETDIFLHRLTDKLTEHIRDEMKKEMQMNLKSEDVRDKVAEKMESYLEAELSTHTCKICFELMTSPVHTPILLFPCGHTFCQQCMDTHVGAPLSTQAARNVKPTTARKGCPYCRVPIDSRAVNQSLKDLIDQFSRQQSMVCIFFWCHHIQPFALLFTHIVVYSHGVIAFFRV